MRVVPKNSVHFREKIKKNQFVIIPVRLELFIAKIGRFLDFHQLIGEPM